MTYKITTTCYNKHKGIYRESTQDMEADGIEALISRLMHSAADAYRESPDEKEENTTRFLISDYGSRTWNLTIQDSDIRL